jgi:hypothetical protein
MSNADRLRSGLGLPLSDILVDIGLVEQHAPSTSSHPSLAHPCQWIRSDTKRYTQQGAAFSVLNFVSPTALAPPTLNSEHVPALVLRMNKNIPRLQENPLLGRGAPHRAPPSVRTFPSDANIHQTQVPSGLVVCRQHTQSTRNPNRNHSSNPPISSPYCDSRSVNMSSTSKPPSTYRQVLLRDRPEHARPMDLSNPRNQLAGHPLAPLLTVPQPPPSTQNLGTAMDPFPIRRGLQTPLVLAAPRSTTDLGSADDFSTRMIDSYLVTS